MIDRAMGLRMEAIKEESLKAGRRDVKALGPLSRFPDFPVCSFRKKNNGKSPTLSAFWLRNAM